MSKRVYLLVKRLLFPGYDFGVRARQKLFKYFLAGEISTLDAGCGNGAFSLAAYQLGNRVLGINIDPRQVQRCQEYAAFIGADAGRLRFLTWNIYNLMALEQKFDQIICSETLEHLIRDQEVVQLFSLSLKPGGRLHLCTPNRLCPFSIEGGISKEEDGGHVRLGYSHEELETLVRSVGLVPVARDEVGGYGRVLATSIQRKILRRLIHYLPTSILRFVEIVAFFILSPLVVLDRMVSYPAWSVYICAEKPGLL